MSDIEDRIERLEISYGIAKGKEPTNEKEFLEQYPDWKELMNYSIHQRIMISEKKWYEKEKWKDTQRPRNLIERWREDEKEVEKELRENPKYLNDIKLQRAIRCWYYYEKIHPECVERELDKEREEDEKLMRKVYPEVYKKK